MKQSDNQMKNQALSEKTMIKNPLRFLLLLIPFAVVLIMGSCLMGISETMPLFIWTLVLMLLGIATYPIAIRLFGVSGSGGFFLSQPLGLIIAGFIVWTFTYIGIMRFNILCIIISLLAIAGFAYGYKPLRVGFIKKINAPTTVERIVFEETLFAAIIVVLCYFKGWGPDINGQEKFMDYGFIMSMLRNSKLPANDMWLSGEPINYYYFGQYLYAFLIKLSAVKTGVGYNLAMCSAIGIPFTMAYSVGCMLIDSSRNYGLRCGKVMTHIAGVVSGLAVMIFGNSHSFFYDQKGMGHGLLYMFDKFGLRVGNYLGNDPDYSFFYPDSTRYIGYNPDSAVYANNGGDYTIEEFPFYSYLVGDLHAHVVSTMVVLLIMAVCISLVSKMSFPEHLANRNADDEEIYSIFTPLLSEYKNLLSVELIAIGFLLGCAQMTNYWDFLIYFIFTSMTLFVLNTRRSKDFATPLGVLGFAIVVGGILGVYLKAGTIPVAHVFLQIFILVIAYAAATFIPCALTRTSFGMSFVFALSSIAALPFNANFDMISNALGAVKNHSSPYQLFILWCTHAFVCITFLVFTIRNKNYQYRPSSKNKKRKNVTAPVIGADSYGNPIAQFFGERNLIDVFVCGMAVVGFLLIIAPEIFYVRDIYTGGHLRANTMFKFCYAAFIILSMAMSYAIIRLFWLVSKKGEYSNGAYAFAVVFCILLIVPGHYTFESLDQRAGISGGNNHFKTLDGTAYLETYNSVEIEGDGPDMIDYANCIEWFNSEVSGPHIILESYGNSYTDYCIVSAYTGNPTVRGWLTHEWLWRFHGIVDRERDLLVDDPEHSVWDIINPRTDAVDIVFSSYAYSDDYDTSSYNASMLQRWIDANDMRVVVNPEDPASFIEAHRQIIQRVINKYNVEYIIIGDLERARYGYSCNASIIESMGTVAFTSGNLTVYHVQPEEAIAY